MPKTCAELTCTRPPHGKSRYCLPHLKRRTITREKLRRVEVASLAQAQRILHEEDAPVDVRCEEVLTLNVKTMQWKIEKR